MSQPRFRPKDVGLRHDSQTGFTTAKHERLALRYPDLHPLRAHHGDITLRDRALSRQREKGWHSWHSPAGHLQELLLAVQLTPQPPKQQSASRFQTLKGLNVSNPTAFLVSVTQTERDSDIIALIMFGKGPIDISYVYVDDSSWPVDKRLSDRSSTRKTNVGEDRITSGPGRETHLALPVCGVGAEAVNNEPEYPSGRQEPSWPHSNRGSV
ncbi:hypothetical protein RhiJN_23663 [Ceratobasidium sp. AG-Ba]|nr:hypothetical protein RhiJN_23663 [Ceratobasidium sp. AG-Ba]